MEKTFFKRITAFSAALTVIAGSAVSCSKEQKQDGKSKDTAQLMAGSYRAVEMDCDVENIRSIGRVNDDQIIISTYDYGEGTPTFYLTDNEFGEFNEISVDFGVKPDDDVTFDVNVAPDGEIMALATFSDYGDIEKPDFEDPDFDYENFDYEEFDKNIKRTYKMYTVDLDGTIKSEKEISGLDEYADDEGRINIGRMSAIGGGRAVLSMYDTMGEDYVLVDADGKAQDKLDLGEANYIDSFSAIDDETIAVTGYFKNSQSIKFLDSETLQEKDEAIDMSAAGLEGQMGSVFRGDDNYKLYVSGSSGLYGLDADNKATEIVNWLDSDLGNGYVSALLFMADGDYVICFNDYQNDEEGLYKLTKRDASELENTKVITVGVLYDDWEVKEKISDYNKSHDDMRFKMVDYSKYDEYDQETGMTITSGADQLKKDIVSGNAPDMIVSYNGALIHSLYNKGLFVDLYDYMNNDSELSKDDIMPNVLSACEIDGKLLSLSPTFTVSTMIAKKKYVDKENWTPDDMIETYRNLPDGMRLTDIDCKESILQMIIGSLGNVIDYEKGTCNFDTPEIRKLLEFCNEFPSQEELIDWEDQSAVNECFSEDNLKNDKVLLGDLYLGDFSEYITTVKGRLKGEDIVFVGNPSTDGRGAVLSLNQHFAILSNAEDKDACWASIKEFFKPVDDEEGSYRYGFSSLRSEFDKEADKTMKKPVYKDENGKEIEEDYTYYDGSKEVKVDPLTQEERDFIVKYIEEADNVSADFDPEVESILEEEIMAYLGGEKTADEIVDLIQNRVSLLVSEQS